MGEKKVSGTEKLFLPKRFLPRFLSTTLWLLKQADAPTLGTL
jgi:hypothetical protein